MSRNSRTTPEESPGWSTDTELVREFEPSADAADAVALTVTEAVERWPELSEETPLVDAVELGNLTGLFDTGATDGSRWLPSVTFRVQGCQVTVLYGSVIRVLVRRDP